MLYWSQPCATAHAFTALHMISSTHLRSLCGHIMISCAIASICIGHTPVVRGLKYDTCTLIHIILPSIGNYKIMMLSSSACGLYYNYWCFQVKYIDQGCMVFSAKWIIIYPEYAINRDLMDRPWQIMLFFCLLFFLTILKKWAYYSSLVYPLFQFKDVTFILKDNLFVVYMVVF